MESSQVREQRRTPSRAQSPSLQLPPALQALERLHQAQTGSSPATTAGPRDSTGLGPAPTAGSHPLLAGLQQNYSPGTNPQPPAYFAFSSRPISASRVQDLVRKNGKNTLIGIDPTYEGSDKTVQAARQAGARLHVYLEGPGGPTGDKGKWDPEEFQRIQKAAAKQGIHIKSPSDSDPGMKQWNAQGWKNYAHDQLREFKKKGFESAELDNLYRGLGDSPGKLVDFYKQYADWYRQGDVPRLMMKNVNKEQMQAVVQAVQSGQLPREMFSDYAIWESDAGAFNGQKELARKLGIQTVVSNNTYDYAASGSY